jgi:hypothetical protein
MSSPIHTPLPTRTDWSQLTDLSGRLLGGILALTYISGFLIATTYLGTYNISASSSELLRAKYIYIGCEYWLFIVVFGLLMRVVRLILGQSQSYRSLSASDRVSVRDLLLRRAQGDRSRRDLRRWFVFFLVTLVFSVEILLLNPEDAQHYNAPVVLFLMLIALYQTTFYREFNRNSVEWGTLYGRKYVEVYRWLYGVGLPGALSILLAIYAFAEQVNGGNNALLNLCRLHRMALITSGCLVATILSVSASLFVTLSSQHLNWLDQEAWRWMNSAHSGEARLRAMVRDYCRVIIHAYRERRNRTVGNRWTGIGDTLFIGGATIAINGVVSWALYDPQAVIPELVLSYVGLTLALVVLANVLVLFMMQKGRDIAIDIDAEESKRETLSARLDRWTVRLGLPTVLFVVSVLGFAYRVYPFIPVQKAGGNYAAGNAVNIYLTNSPASCSPTSLTNEIIPIDRYFVLDEDDNLLYLARESGGGGVECWKWGALCPWPQGWARARTERHRPQVLVVNRRCIAAVIDADRAGSPVSPDRPAIRLP